MPQQPAAFKQGQPAERVRAQHDLLQLHTHAFRRDITKLVPAIKERLPQALDWAEAKRRSKPDGSHHPQGILLKPFFGNANTADQPTLNIRSAVKRINQLPIQPTGDGVHRKIAPPQILGNRIHKLHRSRTTVIRVIRLLAERRHLERLTFH
ncbi:hypothetical protein D3C81_1220320 [compost metagenome]